MRKNKDGEIPGEHLLAGVQWREREDMINPKPGGTGDEKPKRIVRSFYRAFKRLGAALPTLLGVVLLLGLFLTCVSR